ncbi:hypothetical protein JQ631_01655 [Bradyrhizobium manausense]|uniref:hypothetical protein n=1 Tax=Bradyrhizobium manausense TaxID=989370 RepID=UPI001BA90412|nr:hypothetical protein [Bradyrhizobium manausense]MBR0787754.1 hypothetical protein [Bradyrhizobium manausense]
MRVIGRRQGLCGQSRCLSLRVLSMGQSGTEEVQRQQADLEPGGVIGGIASLAFARCRAYKLRIIPTVT